ncbi:MAG: CD225/dispanin family protein [Flavobacteriales bacterium]|nr:CD225/dispanin family protein [Flavobacteriales bacterium]MBK9194880.1 CD225/dispanin family protein [Flavobacteriales bacterium]
MSSTTPGARPKNWLVESILVTIFCCLPLGIVGIINAAKVNSSFDTGNVAGAEKASADAKKWVKWAFIVGIILNVLGGIYYYWMMQQMVAAGIDAAGSM